MGHHFNGYESDFNYFYIDEEYKDDYADFEDNSIHWWYLECNKLEEKEKQSIVSRMLKNHPVDYTVFDFMRIIHPLKPTIEDTIDILKRLKEIGYVTICADFYNLFYDEESFLSSMSNLKSTYSKTVKRKSGLFNLLFSNTERNSTEETYDAEDDVYDMDDKQDYRLAYDEEDIDDIK